MEPTEIKLKKDIKSMSPDELAEEFKAKKLPAFRAKQVFAWLHQKRATSFAEMTDLPAAMREQLDGEYVIHSVKIERKLVSKIDGTVKYLYRLDDGETVEAVLMHYKHGTSLCVSTQAGCKMGCTFCASTIAGFERNLLPSEMLDEVYAAQQDSGERVDGMVLMGIGEPLDNFDNVIKFLRLVSCKEGQNMGMRHISLSTCGLVDKIYDLMEMDLQLTLSISLHASNDERRKKLMPVARRWSIAELLKACREYYKRTGRRISFEYALIGGENDSEADAEELAALLGGSGCHVNLIQVNKVEESGYKRGTRENTERFRALLEKRGINATIRRELGSDINAACGQLRREQKQKDN
ncbi:MAG: 23S rRNA (adenine(2503)-C(2))-methyltransferase RlmN [Oscillospiraceae bacterium]|nr:23S rRNA (adenine(2503)-C(2))-methyltransferase RlmN [Oscillospiraceae bacterium]MBQ3049262.1 23S rRNA (adenine(2503)-C(2))-methyltransferase RlmN [Oscillospiraceae bacterium]MBQ9939720.1 23S rRNA (adenine(2503)-C(2))-methyltransferase RlmN [Oscillospiraceae bacterium]